jgi:hypothetical protein
MMESKGNPALHYAMFLLASGVLSLDRQGRFWRHATVMRRGTLWLTTPRRAECVSGKGYLRLTLYIPTMGLRSVQAHRVIWTIRRGPIPVGLQVNHKDLDKTNNRLGNLELLDQSGNISHSYANGRVRPWSESTEWRPGIARISEATKQEILRLHSEGNGAHRISKRIAVSKTHIHRIIQKATV